MRMWLYALLLAVLAAPPALAQDATADVAAATEVLFFAGAPDGGGRLIASARLDSQVTAEMAQADHLVIRVRAHGFAFVVARMGASVGRTMVRLNAAAMTVAEAAGLVHAALAGNATLVLFTRGGERGTVVAAVRVRTEADLRARVDASGATHVVVANGRVQTFLITRMGDTLATIQVQGSGEAGATGQAGSSGTSVATVAQVLASIGITLK